MKNSQLTNILMGLTAFSAIASALLCWQTINRGRDIRRLQPQAAGIQQSRMAATALVNELTEYGKKNPQIQPILQSIAPKPATNKPAAK